MSSEADRKMDLTIGMMLRIGVSVAAAVVFIGWILYLIQAHGVAPDYQHFHGKPILLGNIGLILQGVVKLDSRRILDIGILLLIATPVARVIFCVADFAVQKDKLYVLVSSIVLAVLAYKLFVSIVGPVSNRSELFRHFRKDSSASLGSALQGRSVPVGCESARRSCRRAVAAPL